MKRDVVDDSELFLLDKCHEFGILNVMIKSLEPHRNNVRAS